jgi:4-carboxymuconolactone decarboxylase
MWDAVAGSERHFPPLDPDGYLLGPFDVLLRAPALGTLMGDLLTALRSLSIPKRTQEWVILALGAHWHAEFEWWAHSGIARHRGATDAQIEALARGERPAFDDADDELAFDVTQELLVHHALSDETFNRAEAGFGARGLTEIIVVAGYYGTICMLLNAFRVPVPDGAPWVWAE